MLVWQKHLGPVHVVFAAHSPEFRCSATDYLRGPIRLSEMSHLQLENYTKKIEEINWRAPILRL